MTTTAMSGKSALSSPRRGLFASKRAAYALKMTIVYTLLVIGGVFVSVPFVWMISTSFKALGQVFIFPPVWIPKPVRWENYVQVFQVIPFASCFKNTVIITFTSVVGLMLASSLAGYSFARLRWKGKNVLFIIVLSTMMLPTQVTMIPQFIVFRHLKWIDTFWPLIVPAFAGSAFQIFLFRQFFMTIPVEYDEAARIDGCTIMGIYWRIILPMSLPVLATGALFAFRFRWDQFLEPLIYLHSIRNYTIALGLRMFLGEYSTSWHYLMAASCVSMLPVLITFFVGQRYFVQGVVVTGIKG